MDNYPSAISGSDMDSFSHVPPGFRFHPTDEELVDYYLRKKVASKRIDLDVIRDVDLYKIEPWDLQELCIVGSEEQSNWYFFSHKDKKYPTGTRTNRATKAGFWKATGRDKAIYSNHILIGMRKTLVFYKGRAPNGQKSDWIMHEYRLETHENGTPQEEGWVVCRAFKKRMTAARKMGDYDPPCWYDDHAGFMPELDSPQQASQPHASAAYGRQTPCKRELDLRCNNTPHQDALFLQLPQLESASSLVPLVYERNNSRESKQQQQMQQIHHQGMGSSVYVNLDQHARDQATDWRVLDKFVASQLSNGNDNGSLKGYSNNPSGTHPMPISHGFVSGSSSTCQIKLWK
ncbi:hypothetical protein SAY87_029467 [Trapa incisa]|uniref:NAC domain-containing protein n=1 Tax=Trapa incisa TaxID=236973 RepID=A0AAN7Q8W2_9MYRT|nr:hypothetical protein SAY87_029467 [Trapa incisa]